MNTPLAVGSAFTTAADVQQALYRIWNTPTREPRPELVREFIRRMVSTPPELDWPEGESLVLQDDFKSAARRALSVQYTPGSRRHPVQLWTGQATAVVINSVTGQIEALVSLPPGQGRRPHYGPAIVSALLLRLMAWEHLTWMSPSDAGILRRLQEVVYGIELPGDYSLISAAVNESMVGGPPRVVGVTSAPATDAVRKRYLPEGAWDQLDEVEQTAFLRGWFNRLYAVQAARMLQGYGWSDGPLYETDELALLRRMH
jgi:hypothetical protein